MSYPYVDLSGVLTVQKDYLANLKNQSQDPNSSSIITNLQSNLSNMYNDFTKANVSTDGVITNQNQMLDIVNSEKKRLLDKKQSVDTALYSQKRAVELNESNRLKQNSYTNLLIVFIITLVLFIGITVLSNTLTFVPQTVFDLLSIIVISLGIYIGIVTYLDILSRNNMNFNELNLGSLENNKAGNTVASGSGGISNLLSGLEGCVGSDCCGPNTVWDQGNGICKSISIVSPFTTMSFAQQNGDISSVSANSAYEFLDYLPIR
jgi:uncharacterized membrane protein